MKNKMLNEEMTIYHDDKTGLDYVSYDGQTLVLLNKPKFKDFVQATNQRNYNDDALAKAYSNRAADVEYESDDDYQKRLERIKHLKNADLAKSNIEKEARKYSGKQKSVNSKGADTKFYRTYKKGGGLDKFKIDLKKLIASQVGMYTVDSYAEYNPIYADTEFLMPGELEGDKKIKPSINVYFDYSNSWKEADIELGNTAMACIDNYRKAGLIDYNLKYFSNEVTDYVPRQLGTHGEKVIEDIKKTRPTNVVVMTDSDYDGKELPQVTVPGGVFFLWKHGDSSKGFIKELKGRKATLSYDIN